MTENITRLLLKVYDNLVSWTTKHQTCVSLSSTEAEYVALGTAASGLLWLIQVLTDVGIKITPPVKILRTINHVSTYLEYGSIVDSNMLICNVTLFKIL